MRQTLGNRVSPSGIGKRILQSETGQMAVFVALIFQVLFVFFAMVINIGLVVHDKINLQNAVDLGAYYAAQRQAEILNEIAHINYQIRQDYKLLTWRYRVMGTLGGRGGRGGNSPALSDLNAALSDDVWMPGEIPSVCAANDKWREFTLRSTQAENYCYQAYNRRLPLSPVLQVVAFFIPGIIAAQASSVLARQNQIASCEDAAGLNWLLAVQMLYSYKMTLAGRKAMIYELRKKLVAPQMLDQSLQPVASGVLKTVQNNLTASNASTFSADDFQVYNGFSHERCAGPNGDGEGVLPEIYTAISLPFTNAERGVCSTYQSLVTEFATLPNPASLARLDPSGVMQQFAGESPTGTEEGKLLRSSLGFEKNPWCMGYVGVKAKTRPRKPFAPFGRPVEMEARAFAQPFGGRVGPWYTKQWMPGDPNSSGTDRTDPLTTARTINGAFVGQVGNVLPYVPNYSRFPGDSKGLSSAAAMASTRGLIQEVVANRGLSYGFYGSFDDIQNTGDPLVWTPPEVPQTPATNGIPNQVAKLRLAENVAVAPDVFDATYYSVEPQYYPNYLALPNEKARFPTMPSIAGKQYQIMPDIGARNTVTEIKAETVASQIVKANSSIDSTLKTSGVLNYFLSTWQHLLTGWSTDSPVVFSFPNEKFGQCSAAANAKVMVPGGCAYGGRTGYSVRVISRDHLISPLWSVGGEGVGPGAILNPPPAEF